MPLDEFWHGDLRLLKAYEKAYYRDKHFSAWLNGSYHLVAITTAMSGLSGKKPIPYPEYKDPISEDKKEDIKVTKDNIEEIFREKQLEQNSWYNNLIK